MRLIPLILLLLVLPAQAQTYFAQVLTRCGEDSLDTQQARVRNQWALKCFTQHARVIRFHDEGAPPSYMLVRHEGTGSHRGPTQKSASCDGWQPVAFCVSSCYPADQSLWFGDGSESILNAIQKLLGRINILAHDSTLHNPTFASARVRAYTRSRSEAWESIYTFKTQSGGELRVTDGHPVLLASGKMIKARDVLPNDALVLADGRADRITHIDVSEVFTKVYNVAPDTGHPKENILVAQGFLVGSAAYQYQEEFASLLGRQFFRETLILPE